MVMNKELCLQCRRLVSVNNQLVILYSVTMCFCLWPTVLAGFSVGDKRHRIIVNAILSQTSAVVTSFAAASLINSDNLFVVVSIRTFCLKTILYSSRKSFKLDQQEAVSPFQQSWASCCTQRELC